MVFFTCDRCGEALKKNQVAKHGGRCSSTAFSCIDCNVVFVGDSYNDHLKCVTENQRYGGKNYVVKENKGEMKQSAWVEQVQRAIDQVDDAQLRSVLKQIQVSAKVRALTELHGRILASPPPQQPSLAEILTTLRYFTQSLVGFLKEMPSLPGKVFEQFDPSLNRAVLYPNLNYSGLFYGLVNLLEVFPVLNSGHAAVGDAILDTFKSLYFFLDRDLIEQLPYHIATQLGVFPSELDAKIVHLLCDCFLPFAVSDVNADSYASLMVPAILMLILQHNGDPAWHTMIVERVMSLHRNATEDLAAVIAKGTSESRIVAANLLMHYWPLNHPAMLLRPVQYKIHAWSACPCESLKCSSSNPPSVRRCLDAGICADLGESAPPLLLCKGCAEDIDSPVAKARIRPLTMAMATAGLHVCQNKGCQSRSRHVYATCFSEDCIRSHQFVPLRLCKECFTALHLEQNDNKKRHAVQLAMDPVWGHPIEHDLVEAVVKLLRETESCETQETKKPKWLRQLETSTASGGLAPGQGPGQTQTMADEKRMLSRFGIWLMSELCPPTPQADPESIGYLLATLYQWFTVTALLPNDVMGQALEQLKTDFLGDWLNAAISNHEAIFIATLQPLPPEFARVGGAWDYLSSTTDQLRDGLGKLLSIMPYDCVSLSTWNRVMPKWLQVISESVEDVGELKVLLCKIFEPELCSLPFEPNKIYQFIGDHLAKNNGESNKAVAEALGWLHLLSRVDIPIPLQILMEMLMTALRRPVSEQESIIEHASIQSTIIDIITRQTKLNELTAHELGSTSEAVFGVGASLLNWRPLAHSQCHTNCHDATKDEMVDCEPCQQAAFLLQMLAHLTAQLCPKQQAQISVSLDDTDQWTNEDASPSQATATPSTVVNLTEPSPSYINKPAPIFPATSPGQHNEPRLQTAMVQEESCEFVGILPTEEVETAMAQAITLTETDVGLATCQVVTATLIESQRGTPSSVSTATDGDKFWQTSLGRFRFSLQTLPTQLQLLHALLNRVDELTNPDVQFYTLCTVKYLCMHAECLTNARREHRGFLVFAQENLLIPKLWHMLRSDFCQVGQAACTLIVHCLTLPCGEDVFWKLVNENFTAGQWQTRFRAVERVYVMAHQLMSVPVKAHRVLQTALCNAFCHLIASVNDPCDAVAQRAILSLQSIPGASLKILVLCLEAQFDLAIVDRPLLLNRLRTLASVLSEDVVLTWEFFIQRFEALAIESQLRSADRSYVVQDLLHSDPMSDLYQRKLTRARQALDSEQTIRSVLRSLGQRAMLHQLANATATGDAPPAVSIISPTYSSSGNRAGVYGRLREFTDEESNMCLVLNRAVDMDNPERHTVYLTVSLFALFLSSTKSSASDEKATAKKQSVLLRHFNTLLGFSNTEKCFTLPPQRLRRSAICNAFLSALPEVLDANMLIANQMLPLIVQLLVHLSSPQCLASDQPQESSLIKLNMSSRHSWLNSLLLILYKYRFDSPPVSEGVFRLVAIVICTLESQCHRCVEVQTQSMPLLSPWPKPSMDSANGGDGADKVDGPRRPVSLLVAESGTSGSNSNRGLVQYPAIIVEPEEEQLKSPMEMGEDGEERKTRQTTTMMSSDQVLSTRCGKCNGRMEKYDEETLSLCLVCICTFLQRQPALAAPLLFRIIHTVSRLIEQPQFPWQNSSTFVPGNSRSAAKQLQRVALHQFSASAICLQLFDSVITEPFSFWKTLVIAMQDMAELNPVAIIQTLLEDIEESWPPRLSRILFNLSVYVGQVPGDLYVTSWGSLVISLEAFFRRFLVQLQSPLPAANNEPKSTSLISNDLHNCIAIFNSLLHVANFSSFKGAAAAVETFSRWLAEAIHGSRVEINDLLSICTACNRAMVRERDKQCITKAVVQELLLAIKFKCSLHEQNYLCIVQLILQDACEMNNNSDAKRDEEESEEGEYDTAAAEAVRPHLNEIVEFIADMHALSSLKKQTVGSESVGGDLKAGLAQVLAVEMNRAGARSVLRLLPWLSNAPSVTQATPAAFAESVSNVRVLSWLLLGAVSAAPNCLPVPIDCSHHMADYIHFVLAGFGDQSKQSVVHMSALFHAFHLCQLWTVYCEQTAVSDQRALTSILDFWARVTPAILQLLAHSKVLADMVNLHFLNTIQSLLECQSAVLCQLYPMWQPILTAYHAQLPSQLRLKLEECEQRLGRDQLTEWLKRVRVKISQIELQTSAASPFYSV